MKMTDLVSKKEHLKFRAGLTRMKRIENILKDANVPPFELERTARFIFSLTSVGIDGLLAVLNEIKEIKK